MDYDMVQKVREALNARLDGQACINIVVPISERTAQRMMDFLERAEKSGLLDNSCDTLNADGTDVHEVDKGNTEWYNEGEEQWSKRLKPLD